MDTFGENTCNTKKKMNFLFLAAATEELDDGAAAPKQ